MPFNAEKFENARFEDRTEAVPVPDLAAWFDEGDTPEIMVRGLTYLEVAMSNDVAAKNKNIYALMNAALSSVDAAQKAEEIADSMGLKGSSEELAKRVEWLKFGSVEPKLTHIQAVKISEVFPVTFKDLTDRVIKLTGKGKSPGESKPSGNETTSGQA